MEHILSNAPQNINEIGGFSRVQIGISEALLYSVMSVYNSNSRAEYKCNTSTLVFMMSRIPSQKNPKIRSYCTVTLVHTTPLINVATPQLHVGSTVKV